MFVGGTNGCMHSRLALGLAGLRCENPVFPQRPLPLPQASAYPHTHFWVSQVLSEFPNPQEIGDPRSPEVSSTHLKSGPFAFPSSPTFCCNQVAALSGRPSQCCGCQL